MFASSGSIVVARTCDPITFSEPNREAQSDISAAVSSNPSVAANVLQYAPPVDHTSVAVPGTREDGVGSSVRDLPHFATAAAESLASAATGIMPAAPEADVRESSRVALATTKTSFERRVSDSRASKLGRSSISAVPSESSSERRSSKQKYADPLPSPAPAIGDLGHGPESEGPPPYHHPTPDIMPGARVGSRYPVVSTTQVEENVSTMQVEENPIAVLVGDGEVGGGAMGNDAILTGDDATDDGKTVHASSSGQGTGATVAAGTTRHADDTHIRDTSANSLPSNRRASSDGFDVVEAVVEAAHVLAGHSAIPGVSEAAKLVSILVKMVTDHRDGTREVEWRVKRCRAIIFMLDRAGKVLGKVRQRTIPSCGINSCPCVAIALV